MVLHFDKRVGHNLPCTAFSSLGPFVDCKQLVNKEHASRKSVSHVPVLCCVYIHTHAALKYGPVNSLSALRQTATHVFGCALL